MRRGRLIPTRSPLARVLGAVLLSSLATAAPAAAQQLENVYQTLNRDAADTTNTDQLWPSGSMNLDLTGAGVTVGIWDGGDIRHTHELFNENGTGRVTVIDNFGDSSHATHVAGTIGGDTSGGTQSRGMALNTQLRSRDFYDDRPELSSDASLIDLSNHSYSYVRGWSGAVASTTDGPRHRWFGNYDVSGTEDHGFGLYGNAVRELDQILHDNPHLLSVWAAGNDRGDSYVDLYGDGRFAATFNSAPSNYHEELDNGLYVVSSSTGHPAPPSDGNGGTGYDTLSNSGQVAKNTLVVGALNDYLADPHDGSAPSMAPFSSVGPTDDGRLAPHVVANGVGLRSSIATGDTNYSSESGTSMAAPNVTGSAALLLEHYRDVTAGQDPRAATQKALLVHTATDITSGSANPGPDYVTGYGLVNAADAAAFLTEAHNSTANTRSRHLTEDTLQHNNTFVSSEMVAVDNTVKATLAWTDPEGPTQSGLDDSTSVLVNDLDLWVEDALSNTYYPWTLDGTNPTQAAVQSQANHLDNLEQVLIEGVTLGDPFTVHVGHTGNLLNNASQDFSLLFSGLASVPEPASLVLVGAGALLILLRDRPRRATMD